jgi:UPF0042 nucleotide-binding protein
VTGLSGAGKSTSLNVLEDLGYEVVDNLPIKLVANLLPGEPGAVEALAVGVDARTRDFQIDAVLAEIDRLTGRPDLAVSVLYLDCEDEILHQRFTETRRRHPLADDRPVSDGILRERRLMERLRSRADLVVDTTNLSSADLRRVLAGNFALGDASGPRVFVTSFGFRYGLPREADLVFDVRFLRNPHYVDDLRPLDGRNPLIAKYVTEDAYFKPFFDQLCAMIAPLLPRYEAEGKSYLTIAIGCTGGRHRSTVVAEMLAERLAALPGVIVDTRHRDIDRATVSG